jgi:hypothetical protein
MSLLLRNRESGKIIYYAKGAEIVMESIIKPLQRSVLLEYCDELATIGLRTLVFA